MAKPSRAQNYPVGQLLWSNGSWVSSAVFSYPRVCRTAELDNGILQTCFLEQSPLQATYQVARHIMCLSRHRRSSRLLAPTRVADVETRRRNLSRPRTTPLDNFCCPTVVGSVRRYFPILGLAELTQLDFRGQPIDFATALSCSLSQDILDDQFFDVGPKLLDIHPDISRNRFLPA